jgi:hypothetical protein
MEARSPDLFSDKINSHEFMKTAREVLKESIRRQEIIGRLLAEPSRLSPGGPDPHHN